MILDGFWDFAFLGEVEPGRELPQLVFREKFPVPGCFDVEPGYKLRRGVAAYRTRVAAGGKVTLTLDAVGPKGKVYWDGKLLAECVLPFSREEFRFDAGAETMHELCIVIDARVDTAPESLFPGFYDFYRHGGIYRSVSLRKTPDFEISYVKVIPLDLQKEEAEITVELSGQFPAVADVRFTWEGGGVHTEKITDGKGCWRLTVPDCRVWSPEHPELHTLAVSVLAQEKRVTFGMRTFEAKEGQFFLNGKPLKLIGYNRHDCHPDFGYAVPESLVRRDLEMIKRQGCNFIRGCHYPQSEAVLNWCDRLGLLVWEESLGWGNDEKSLDNAEFCKRQREQTLRMVRKSINHPCVILHGFMNELKSSTESAKKLIRSLAAIFRAEDPSRPVTYATKLPFEDVALTEVDVVSINAYPGWYYYPQMGDNQEFDEPALEKALQKFETVLDRPELAGKPFILSEIGGAALAGFHGDVRWAEEYQADLAVAVFRHVLHTPRCSGLALWMFCDTRSFNDFRAPGRVRGFNNKGVVDEYRRPKMAWNAITRLLEKEKKATAATEGK